MLYPKTENKKIRVPYATSGKGNIMLNYELNRHKKSDKIKWIVTALVAVLLTAACATSIAMGVKNNGWFKKDEDTKIEQPVDPAPASSAAIGLDVAVI